MEWSPSSVLVGVGVLAAMVGLMSTVPFPKSFPDIHRTVATTTTIAGVCAVVALTFQVSEVNGYNFIPRQYLLVPVSTDTSSSLPLVRRRKDGCYQYTVRQTPTFSLSSRREWDHHRHYETTDGTSSIIHEGDRAPTYSLMTWNLLAPGTMSLLLWMCWLDIFCVCWHS